MVGKNTKDRPPLLPDRMGQRDFFVCDIFDAAPKGDAASMAHPIFSLSTKPDHRIRRYESGSTYVEVKPGADGLATVHDRDVLIYCISQVMAAFNEGRQIARTLRFKAYDLLKATNRGTDGRGYEQLKAAFSRLRGTSIETNITTNDVEIIDGFGLIDSYRIVRETRDGRMLDAEITLSDWVFNAIQAQEVLTLHRDYFRLRKPLERRIYELARKHCGKQPEWKIGLEKLRDKCGSASTLKEFRRLVSNIIGETTAYDHIPDYRFALEDDLFIVWPKPAFHALNAALSHSPVAVHMVLKPETYEKARNVAQGWDIYELENEWRTWMSNKEAPKNPDTAFIAFCRKRGAHPQFL